MTIWRFSYTFTIGYADQGCTILGFYTLWIRIVNK
jgi:hypothetical protein